MCWVLATALLFPSWNTCHICSCFYTFRSSCNEWEQRIAVTSPQIHSHLPSFDIQDADTHTENIFTPHHKNKHMSMVSSRNWNTNRSSINSFDHKQRVNAKCKGHSTSLKHQFCKRPAFARSCYTFRASHLHFSRGIHTALMDNRWNRNQRDEYDPCTEAHFSRAGAGGG